MRGTVLVLGLGALAAAAPGKRGKSSGGHRNWYAGNVAYNNGLASLLEKRAVAEQMVYPLTEDELNQIASKKGASPAYFTRNTRWDMLDDHARLGVNWGAPVNYPKRGGSNWFAGNTAYNNGLSSLLHKRNSPTVWDWGASHHSQPLMDPDQAGNLQSSSPYESWGGLKDFISNGNVKSFNSRKKRSSKPPVLGAKPKQSEKSKTSTEGHMAPPVPVQASEGHPHTPHKAPPVDYDNFRDSFLAW